MEFVTVACKVPNGLLLEVPGDERRIKLNGSRPLVNDLGREVSNFDIEAGAGLTQVPKDFYDKWKEHYKDYEPLKNQLIISAGDQKATVGEAVAMESVKSKLEPLDPEKIEETHKVQEEEDAADRNKKQRRRG